MSYIDLMGSPVSAYPTFYVWSPWSVSALFGSICYVLYPSSFRSCSFLSFDLLFHHSSPNIIILSFITLPNHWSLFFLYLLVGFPFFHLPPYNFCTLFSSLFCHFCHSMKPFQHLHFGYIHLPFSAILGAYAFALYNMVSLTSALKTHLLFVTLVSYYTVFFIWWFQFLPPV